VLAAESRLYGYPHNVLIKANAVLK